MKRRFDLALVATLCAALLLPAARAMTPEEASMIANAAKRGNPAPQLLLGLAYLDGDGGYPKDSKQAVYWLEQSALQGNAYAQESLAELYERGDGVQRDLKLAIDWREKAANRGNLVAQYRLGEMYLEGEGVAKDVALAKEWIDRAAVEGSHEAQLLLGRMYREGIGIKADPAKAKQWMDKSAAQGDPIAIKLIHMIEEFGFKAEEEIHQRMPELTQLAEDGDVEAQYQLAVRYESGLFETKDKEQQALYWFKRAADKGHVKAMRSLAHIYREGLNGVVADPQVADEWARKADTAAPTSDSAATPAAANPPAQ